MTAPISPSDKTTLRHRCWAALRASGDNRFPGVEGRIPNFIGAEAAADRLTHHPLWQAARTLKCNPDSPHRPVRHRALLEGRTVIMAVPKLRSNTPFLSLDPSGWSRSECWRASSAKGAAELGAPLTPEEVPVIDLIVTGCVGATAQGARLGKGGGFSDLEYAVLRALGRVEAETPVASTIHPSQLLPDGAIPMDDHDVSLDVLVLPNRTIDCPRPFQRPLGLLLDRLDAEKRSSIPFLDRFLE